MFMYFEKDWFKEFFARNATLTRQHVIIVGSVREGRNLTLVI